MTQVTGTGCLLSAICAAALTIDGNSLELLQVVMQNYKDVATKALEQDLLGSFQVGVLNAIHELSRGEEY